MIGYKAFDRDEGYTIPACSPELAMIGYKDFDRDEGYTIPAWEAPLRLFISASIPILAFNVCSSDVCLTRAEAFFFSRFAPPAMESSATRRKNKRFIESVF